jgi:hypothetical protein
VSFRSLLPVTLLALSACAGPVDTVVKFHRALVYRDGKAALGLLSEATRAELAKRAAAAREVSAGVIAADPAEMIVQGDLSIYPDPGPTGAQAVSAKLVSEQQDRAEVEVTIGEERHRVALVRESGGWRLELPLSGQPAP